MKSLRVILKKVLRIITVGIIPLLMQGCVVDKSSQAFQFPGGAIAPAPGAGSGGTQASISILSTSLIQLSNYDVIPGNIAYDGTKILWMSSLAITNCFPGNIATFQYLTLDFTAQTTSNSTYPGIPSGVDCNGQNYSTFGTTAGKSGLFWMASGTGHLVTRDDSSGNVLTTESLNMTSFGCGSATPLLAYCNGLYYGVCSPTVNSLRLFSFDSAGSLQSAISTNFSDYANLRALSCYVDSSLLLVANESTIYKYNLNFGQVAVGSYATALPDSLATITGLTTDGTSLYLQGSVDSSGGGLPTVTLGKASLGNLK